MKSPPSGGLDVSCSWTSVPVKLQHVSASWNSPRKDLKKSWIGPSPWMNWDALQNPVMPGVCLKETIMGATRFGNSLWQQQLNHGTWAPGGMLNARASVTCPRPLGVETARITNSLTLSSWEASIIIHELNVVSGGSVEVRHVGKTQCEAVMMRSLRGLHPTLEPPEHGWLQLRSQGRWTSQSGRGQVPKVVLIFLLYWKWGWGRW